MSKRNRLMLAGGVVALLAIIVLYLNFFAPERIPEEAEQAMQAADENAQTAPPPEPEPARPAPKRMEPFQPGR